MFEFCRLHLAVYTCYLVGVTQWAPGFIQYLSKKRNILEEFEGTPLRKIILMSDLEAFVRVNRLGRKILFLRFSMKPTDIAYNVLLVV